MMQFTAMAKKCQAVKFLNHNAPVCLAQIVKPMLAKNHFQEMREPQYSLFTQELKFILHIIFHFNGY